MIYTRYIFKNIANYRGVSMKKMNGKKYLIFLIVALLFVINIMPVVTSTVFSRNNNLENIADEDIKITVQDKNDIITINYKIINYNLKEISIENKQYFKVILGEESNFLTNGKPDLPNICRSIIIPDNSKMKIEVTKSSYEEIKDILISPSKGNLLRSINPDDVSYIFDETYEKDSYFPEEIAELNEPYIIRDFRGQVVQINPFQYNPVQKTLRIYKDITVKIYPEGLDTYNVIKRTQPLSSIDTDFKQIYEKHFINYGLTDYTPIEEQGNMLIITYDNFWDTMQPFVQWKNLKGIPTEMVKVTDIGNEYDIETYIQQYYYDNGLTFVLLVGDEGEVPTLTAGYSASDPSYSYIAGDDHYPDIFIGRFSAQNTEDLETQVERSIEYEKYPQVGVDWYIKGAGVASSQGPGDDNEMDYEHIRNIRTKLMNYGYIEVDEFYDGSQGGEDAPGNPTPSMVATAIDNGRSVTNYCGHGGPTGWGSSGFSNYDIDALINDNMLPYVICVACNNGQFDDYDACFCEAWLRATNSGNGEPTGAIAATGSTKGMSWDPPMDAQDEMMDLLVESYVDNVKHTIGGIHANGCMHMNDQYGTGGYSETDTWHVFGDPSIQIRTKIPAEMTVHHSGSISYGTTTYNVEVEDIKNALCAISFENVLLGYGLTDDTGNAVIELFEPFSGEEEVDLVVTAYNTIPYYSTIATNTAPDKPQRPDGPDQGSPGSTYLFSSMTTDSDGDNIYYYFSWGDGTYSDWVGPFENGQTGGAMHSWEEQGTYEIKVKAMDVYGEESEWSEPFSVSMPKNKSFYTLFLDILEQRFPIIFSIINGLI